MLADGSWGVNFGCLYQVTGNSGIVVVSFLLFKASHGDTLVVEWGAVLHDIDGRIRTILASNFCLLKVGNSDGFFEGLY